MIVALVGPLFVDWTSYRAAFERQATQVLGQPVQVLGDADMQILPLPRLHFESVHVGPEGEAPILVVDEFDIRIELLPLLQGKVEVVDMALQSPALKLKMDEKGRIAFRQDGGKLWELDLANIRLNDVRIKDGSISLEEMATGRKDEVQSLNGTLQARSLVGPYKIESSFQFNGQPYSLMLSTGSAGDDGMRVKSLLTPFNLPITLSLDGNVKSDEEGRYHYIGATRLANQIEGLEGVVPWELTGESDLTVSTLSMPAFEFSHGDVDQAFRLAGSGTIDFGSDPRFDIAVSSRQLDLDRTLGKGPDAPIDLQDGLRQMAGVLSEMPAPPMPGRVGFEVPGVILAGGIIRNFLLEADHGDKGWQVETLEADLPGQTRLAMSGLFSRVAEADGQGQASFKHAFDGVARIRSDQPDGFAKWWLKDGANVGRLVPFDLSGKLLVKPDEVAVSSMVLDLDGNAANGRIDWMLGDQDASGAASLAVDLKAGQLDLDAVQGIGELLLSNSRGRAAPLGDIHLDVETDKLIAGDFEGERLAAKLSIAEGGVDINRLVVEDFAGAYLSVTGNLDDLSGTPKGEILGELRAKDLTGLSSLASRLLPDNAAAKWFEKARSGLSPADVSFSIDAGTEDGNLKGKLSGLLGGGNASLDASLKGALSTWASEPLSVDLKLDNPDGRRLFNLVGLGEGFLELPALTSEITIDGSLNDGAKLKAKLSSEDGALDYEGSLSYADRVGWASKGGVTLTVGDLSPFLLGSGLYSGDFSNDLPLSLSASLDHSKDLTRIADIKGQWDGQPVVGALDFKTTLTDRDLSGSLEVGDLDGIWLGETVLGAGRLTSEGKSWPDGAFVAAIEGNDELPIKVSLDVKARSLSFAEPYVFQQPKFDLLWRQDSLNISNFEGLLAGGKTTGGLQLENVGGEGVVKSHFRVDGADLSPFIWARDGRAVANGTLDLNVTVESQGRSMAGLVSGLSGNGTFAIRDAVLQYVNPEAFEQVVRAVDAGLELKEAEIKQAFVAHMNAGSTRVSNLSGTFGIAGGALRANNMEAEAAILQSRGSVTIDLSARTINSDWSIKVEPNEEDAVTGAQPEVGLVFSGDLGAPQRIVDVAPFTGYLSIRAFEREVDRVERMQADILEKDRMRRLLRLYREQKRHREEAVAEAERVRIQAIEDEKLRAKAAEEARRKAAEEAALREAEAKRKAEEARKAKLEAERREAEARRLAEEQAKAEAARKAAEEKARREAEARRLAEEERKAEEVRQAAEEAARQEAAARFAEEQRKLEEAQKAAQERERLALEAQKRAEEEAAKAAAARAEAERLAEEARKAAEEAARQRAIEEQRRAEALARPGGIEFRRLDDLTPETNAGAIGSNAAVLPEADIPQPEADIPREAETFVSLPDRLFTLPRAPAERPRLLAPVSPITIPSRTIHNDLINELRSSPDRIIQLD